MSVNRERWADKLAADQESGLKGNFLAAEERLDRRTMWRLGGLGTVTIAAIVGAVLALQSPVAWDRAPVVSSALVERQAQQINRITAETQTEFNRLALAVDQLSSDRDQIRSRVATVEANSASIKRTVATLESPGYIQAAIRMYQQSPTLTAQTLASASAPEAVVAEKPVETTVAAAAPDTAAPLAPTPAGNLPQINVIAANGQTIELDNFTASSPAGQETTGSIPEAAALPARTTSVGQTHFGIDLGGAKSMEGLRAMWRGLIKTDPAMADLQPIIKLRERANGLGMQLRLVVGPIQDAADAARHCAVWAGRGRACETTAYDGQRLSMQPSAPRAAAAPAAVVPPAMPLIAPIPPTRKRTSAVSEPQVILAAPQEDGTPSPAPPPTTPTLGSILGFTRQ